MSMFFYYFLTHVDLIRSIKTQSARYTSMKDCNLNDSRNVRNIPTEGGLKPETLNPKP